MSITGNAIAAMDENNIKKAEAKAIELIESIIFQKNKIVYAEEQIARLKKELDELTVKKVSL